MLTRFFLARAVYEITWENTVEPDRSQMTIWRMRFARWITEVTSTQSEYVQNYCLSTATMVTRTRLNVPLYTHRLCCYNREGRIYCAVRKASLNTIQVQVDLSLQTQTNTSYLVTRAMRASPPRLTD
jgi:formamidopyrimidine-DNA glycosylase